VAEADPDSGEIVSPSHRPQAEVLEDLARLHQRFDDEQVDFETFEASKRDLMAELSVE
jgi:hypothetical protein